MGSRTPRPPGNYPPNSTVYVRNLEERIQPQKVIKSLELIFSEYGNVIDVVVKTSLKRKGQAFVVFDDVDSATRAIEEVQSFEIFGKPMILEYARTQSDAFVKLNGDENELELHKRKRVAEKHRKQALEAQEAQKLLKRPPGPVEPSTSRPIKVRGAGLKSTGGAAAVIPDEYLPPNKTVFVQNIPEDYYDIDALTGVFERFEGFREVRLVPGRKGIAFVEYEAEAGAISAKERMANVPLGETGQAIKVTYQRQ